MSQQKKNIFIDASLNSQPWFDDLPIEYQMAYSIHIWIDSNNIGVWKPHLRELYFKLKQEIDPDDFLEAVNSDSKHIEVLDSGDWWLIDYLPLQVRTLTPNNRPHVSYIEDLREHGLLTRYAKENPENVKFEVIEELEDWENIEDFDKKKKAKSAYQYLDSKGLVRPLKEACKTLARSWQDSKEKEEEQEEDQERDEEENKEEDELTHSYVVGQNGESKKDSVKPNSDNSYYETLKKKIGGLALVNSGSLSFEKDVDRILEELSDSDVLEPKDYLIEQVKATDWITTDWKDFKESILTMKELPF